MVINMKNNVLKWIWKKIRRSVGGIVVLTLLSVTLAGVALSFSLVSKTAIDSALSGRGFDKTVFIQLAALLAIQLIAQTATTFLNVSVEGAAEINIRRSIFSGLIKKDFLSVTKYHSAELLNRINSDVGVICGFAVNVIPALTMFLTKIIAGLVLLFMLDKVFAIAMILFVPFVLLIASLYKKRFKSLHIKCQETDGRTRAFMQETLQNLLVIKSFMAEKKIVKASDKLQIENYRYKVKRAITSILANTGMFILFNAGYYFALAWGAYRVQCGIITAGSVFAIITLIGQIQSPIKELSSVIPQFYAMWASAERIMELERIPNDKKVESYIPYIDIAAIGFDNVTFAYSDDAGVEKLSMKIRMGVMTAIAGESGVGKSTAMKLLLGIMTPDEGTIYVDTRSGERCDVDFQLRKLFAYVPQGNMILSGTIRENIAFASENVTDEDIINAAKIAQIWDFISSLENGLDTKVGEKGLGLSEGQVQRVAIARAILYGAPILLFDEATSALDEETESKLIEALRTLEDRTCIIITHRPNVINMCDDVVRLENED